MLGRRTITLEIRSHLREADFRRLYRQVHHAWNEGLEYRLPARGRRTRTITQVDTQLVDLMERMPEDDRSFSWEQRAAAWKAETGLVSTSDTLRIRWHRLKTKLATL